MSDNSSPPRGFSPVQEDTGEREAYIRDHPPRLPPLASEEMTDREKELFEQFSTLVVDGQVRARDDRDSIQVLIRHGELYKAHLDVAQKFLSDGEMSSRQRELVVLRTAWLSRAPFEWGAHVNIAHRIGMSTGEVERIIEGSAAEDWDEHDRALVRAAEELHFDSMITDETWAVLERHLTPKQLIELVILVGQYKTVAYYQNALRFRLPDNNRGLSAR